MLTPISFLPHIFKWLCVNWSRKWCTVLFYYLGGLETGLSLLLAWPLVLWRRISIWGYGHVTMLTSEALIQFLIPRSQVFRDRWCPYPWPVDEVNINPLMIVQLAANLAPCCKVHLSDTHSHSHTHLLQLGTHAYSALMFRASASALQK